MVTIQKDDGKARKYSTKFFVRFNVFFMAFAEH